MKNKISPRKIIMITAHLLMIISILCLLIGSVKYKRDGPTVHAVAYVTQVQASVDGGPWEEITLPHTFKDLDPRTNISIAATITPEKDDGVYIKTVYSPAKVYLGGKLVFEFGKRENYPDFMIDPATEIHIVETYGNGENMKMQIDFQSPKSRDRMIIHPPMVGTAKELIMERSRSLGIPLIFSIVQIVSGISMILISICIILIDKKGILFLWLGLFSLSTGIWAFGENNFSGIIFRQSAFLYMLSFIGLFTFIVPLFQFARTIIDFENPKPIWGMELFFVLGSSAALFLQLAGILSCSASMYLFHAVLPIALITLTVFTVREYLRYANHDAKRFILPMWVLALTAILELFNYQFGLTYVFSSLFQMGILVFLLIMGIEAGMYIKDSINLHSKEKELAFEKSLVDIQIKEQTERSLLLAGKEQTLRRQRHDLRHQLMVIQDLASKENTELQDYLHSLMDQIPAPQQRFCENRTVNAIIAHYVPICKKKGIDLTMNLVVPNCKDLTSDSKLCVIFGNLLENAMEACCRMEAGKRFIKINSSMQYDLITITMDNSFNGKIEVRNGRYRSAKRDDYGIGIASIQSISQQAGGGAEFKREGNVFLSSVYLKI